MRAAAHAAPGENRLKNRDLPADDAARADPWLIKSGSTNPSVHHLLEALQGDDADFLAGRLRLENHLFLGEGIDALARLRGGLAHHGHLAEAGGREQGATPQSLLVVAADRFRHPARLPLGGAGCVANSP